MLSDLLLLDAGLTQVKDFVKVSKGQREMIKKEKALSALGANMTPYHVTLSMHLFWVILCATGSTRGCFICSGGQRRSGRRWQPSGRSAEGLRWPNG